MNYTLNKGGQGVIINVANKIGFDRYLSEIAKFKPLTHDEEFELFEKIKNDNDEDAIRMICKHNMLFVVQVARHFAASTSNSLTLTLEDLVNEGNLGMVESIQTFDHNRGYKFISHAVWKIRHRILCSIQKNSKTIRVPYAAYKEMATIKDKKSFFEQQIGAGLTLSEVFDKLVENGETKESDTYSRLAHLDRMLKFEKSLNSTVGEDAEIELSETIVSEYDNVDEIMVSDEKKKFVHSLLNQLPDDVLKYFMDYYGFSGEKKMSYREISEKYGVSKDTVISKINIYLKVLKRNNKHIYDLHI